MYEIHSQIVALEKDYYSEEQRLYRLETQYDSLGSKFFFCQSEEYQTEHGSMLLEDATPREMFSSAADDDDIILKRLMAMGWALEESLKALEACDYNIGKVGKVFSGFLGI